MISVENIDVWGFEHAIRGMRNPMNSWNKSDTTKDDEIGVINVGENDLALMNKLYKAGTEHRKYLRQIFVSMDITAPLYWWKEFDTYKVGTVANSCSTMHTIHKKKFELSDFSFDDFWDIKNDMLFSSIYEDVINQLENLRKLYIETNDKIVWRAIVQLLPESYNQKRTITMNYENVVNVINQRENHKLDEWNNFIVIMLLNLPYIKEIMGGKGCSY